MSLQVQKESTAFPQMYIATGGALEDALAWIGQERQTLLAESAQHGVVLFRGFPFQTDRDFDAFIRAFQLANFTYADSLSNAVRVNRTERVFTANEAPADVYIHLHHEMAQTPIFPSRLFFFCEHAPEVDGETPVCRSDWLLEELTKVLPEFVEAGERLGVRYRNTMPADDDPESGQGRSWRSTLNVETQAAAEERLGDLGYEWTWGPNSELATLSPMLPAIRHLKDGRRIFFNQLIAAFAGWSDGKNAICFGDKSPIPEDAMRQVTEIAQRITYNLPWQTGDAVLIDNYLVMHGRRPYQGTRRVLASLVASDLTPLKAAS